MRQRSFLKSLPVALRSAAAALLWLSFAVQAGQYTVPLFVAASAGGDPQSVLRLVNETGEAATIKIYSIADDGARTEPATLLLNASAAVQFSATELESGDAARGLAAGIGNLVGEVRLSIDSDVPIVPSAYVRNADGTLSAMNAAVLEAVGAGREAYRYDVAIFHPASNVTQPSRLRLINPGDAPARVTISARDDTGMAASGGTVELTLPAGGARTLSAQQLEAGNSSAFVGRLGAGVGNWRLSVSSDRPVQAVNVTVGSGGEWRNLSSTAVSGWAPETAASFEARFLERAIVSRDGQDRLELRVLARNRFRDVGIENGIEAIAQGRYGYERTGRDAGRMILEYDSGKSCEANLHFSSTTAGWYASGCVDADESIQDWTGGHWFAEEADDGTETANEVGDSLPGVPTSGRFIPSVMSGGSVSATAGGTTVALNEGGYFELNDGTRYTCVARTGCTILDGTVTTGTVTGRAAGAGEMDRFPSFRGVTGPGNQGYALGTAIDALTLPEAGGGNGVLTYSLSPVVPGLSFNATMRRLTGTPTTAGAYDMTYTVKDEDGDADSLRFAITVSDGTPAEGYLGACRVGMTLSSGESCTYPGTTDDFSVNTRGRGRFLTFLAGIRIAITNQTINGRVYDFEAAHQGDGVWRIDRLAGSTESPAGTSPSFAGVQAPGNRAYTVGTEIAQLTLPAANGGDGALTYRLSPEVPGLRFDSTTRRLTGTPSTAGDYDMTYSATDEDGDSDSIGFAIAVEEADGGAGSQAEVSVQNGTCSGSRRIGMLVELTMTGTVTANVAVSNLRVSGYGNGQWVGTGFLGSLADGASADFSISGSHYCPNKVGLTLYNMLF